MVKDSSPTTVMPAAHRFPVDFGLDAGDKGVQLFLVVAHRLVVIHGSAFSAAACSRRSWVVPVWPKFQAMLSWAVRSNVAPNSLGVKVQLLSRR